MNFPCTLCGGRDWPAKDDPCPLCRASDEDEKEPPDPYDSDRYDDTQNRLINGIHHAARKHRHDL